MPLPNKHPSRHRPRNGRTPLSASAPRRSRPQRPTRYSPRPTRPRHPKGRYPLRPTFRQPPHPCEAPETIKQTADKPFSTPYATPPIRFNFASPFSTPTPCASVFITFRPPSILAFSPAIPLFSTRPLKINRGDGHKPDNRLTLPSASDKKAPGNARGWGLSWGENQSSTTTRKPTL